jgi:hypothetical protein
MISASRFARIHSSTWRSLTPTTDLYVRKVNGGMVVRHFAPIRSITSATRRAFINEIGFDLFATAARTGERATWQNPSNLECAVKSARNRIRQFGSEEEAIVDPVEDERRECSELARRLHDYFEGASNSETIEIHPIFPGCGIVDASAGDVFFDGTLWEVKAGDRSFLSTDVRQLLIYAALNKASGARIIRRIGLVNPRIGVSFLTSIDEACVEVSGRQPEELLNEIIMIISSGDTSR